MTYVATVMRDLTPHGNDRADVYESPPYDREPATNSLRHVLPIENDISHYSGTFDTREEAIAAISAWFPKLRIAS